MLSAFGIIMIVFFVQCYIGMGVAEFFLAKCSNSALGLIMPIISFIISFLIGINVTGAIEFLIMMLLLNIPTAVYLVIYFCIRKKKKNKPKIR